MNIKAFREKFLNKNVLKNYLLMIIGTFLTACATMFFFNPNKIVCGGISGVSTILYYIVSLPVGWSYAIINLLLLAIGIKVLGKEFIIKTVIGTVLMSLFMELLSFVPIITSDRMLSSIFGGILYGVGLGLTFIAKASTGGTDIIGRLIQYKFKNVSIGKLLAILDGIIILASAIVFREINLILFGIIGVFVQSITIDYLIGLFNSNDMVLIITSKEKIIRDYISENYNRGLTVIDAYGYANKEADRAVIVCVMKSKQSSDFREKINSIDAGAFVIFTEAKSILGKGFKYYK